MFNRGKTSLPFVFLGPPLAVMALLGLVPTVAAINLALKNRVLRYPDSEYVWLRNFSNSTIAAFSERSDSADFDCSITGYTT